MGLADAAVIVRFAYRAKVFYRKTPADMAVSIL
jgi:hypothetical protein